MFVVSHLALSISNLPAFHKPSPHLPHTYPTRPDSEKNMWHDLMVRHSQLAVPHLDCIADANGAFASFTGEDCHLGFHVHQYGLK